MYNRTRGKALKVPGTVLPRMGGARDGLRMREGEGWYHWSGVLLEDPPASGSAVVRPPIREVESYARRRTPCG